MAYIVGYARTSTLDQVAGLEAQVRDLEAAGCRKVFQEQLSSLATRPQLDAAIAYLREGDVLVVTALDRLARSMRDMLGIVERVKAVGASLRILKMNLDTADATSELILNVIGSVAQWERARMLERQAEGIAKAKAEGKYKGRVPTAQRKAPGASTGCTGRGHDCHRTTTRHQQDQRVAHLGRWTGRSVVDHTRAPRSPILSV